MTRTAPGVAAAEGLAERLLTDPDRLLSDFASRVLEAVAAVVGRYGPLAAAVAVVAAVFWLLLRCHRSRRLAAEARFVSILAPPEVDPAGAEALWTTLHDLLRPAWRRLLAGQPHLAFELHWTLTGLHLGLWVPALIPPRLVERAVEAAWPAARTTTTDPNDVGAGDATVTAGALRLAARDWFPLRSDHPSDPLRQVIGAAGDLTDADGACVQVLARPVTGRRLARSHKAARTLRVGRPPTLAARLLDTLTPGPTPAPRPVSGDPTRAADIRAILDKAAGPGWEIAVRYAVTTTHDGKDARRRLRGRAHALASAFAAYTGRNRLARHSLRRPATTLVSRRFGRGDLVSVAELAALAHLPTDTVVAGLARAGANTVPPAPAIATVGKVLGDADAGTRRLVALTPADARYHLHLLGATGSGKSTLLTNLVLDDVTAGRGAVVIDPKGDLVTDILDRLPTEAAGRVVLIDPDDTAAPPALNVLEGADPDLTVDHLVGIFRRIYQSYWGPRTDDVLRSACLTLLRRSGATLADVPRLLADERFRRPYLDGIDDPVGLGGFWDWYQTMSRAQQAQVVGPVLNKLRAFLLRGFVRDVVGTTTSSFDMTAVLDAGLCLVRVPKGVLGEETARLLGSFVVARVWQAATARARHGQPRADAALYVDEAHNFLTLPRSFDEMLAEARGYHLSLVLAHQHLAQLPRELRDALSANARNKLYFAMSPEDARHLERHVTPELTGHDLANLGAYQAAARLVVDGAEQPACTLTTRPAVPPIPGRAEAVRAAARRLRAQAQRIQGRAHGRRERRSRDPRQRPAAGPPTGRPTAAPPHPPTP